MEVEEVLNQTETVPEETQLNTEEPSVKKKDKKQVLDDELKSFEEDATVVEPKKKKYGWVGTVILLAAIAVGIYLMFSVVHDAEAKSLSEAIASSDWRWFLATLAVLLVIMLCDWMKYVTIMRTTTGKFNLRSSLKVSLLGKFYDNVTPFAAGGQPMQIYYLHKKGFSGGISSAVVLIRYFAQMFAWTIVGVTLMSTHTGILSNLGDAVWEHTIMIAAWIGLAVNAFLPLMIALFALFPKLAKALTSFVVSLGAKVKIVKDKEKTMKKAEKVVSEFRAGFKIMSRNPLGFISLMFFCLGDVVLTYALPFFVLKTFSALPEGGGILMLFSVMALNVYAAQSVTVIPSPGNSGAMEVVVAKAFSAVASAAVLSWSVLTWRFGIYYIYIIIGIGMTIFTFIRQIVRARRAKKLEAVSTPPVEPDEAQSDITEQDKTE
ncbi:MAG: flippase-like domain-containing protein [Clostridia bacterium]|nr:flippase-like domain-containing protein [Clostridia bacterium]